MFTRHCWVVVLAIVGVGGIRAEDLPKVVPLQLEAEPLAIKPGTPLGPRVLVSTPAELNGTASWTIDSRRHRGAMLTLAANPDGTLLATGGYDNMVRIWDLETGKLLRVLVAYNSHHNNATGELAWSPCGNVLAVAGYYDSLVRLWDARSGQLLKTIKGFKGGYVGRLAWSPDGTRLAAGGYPSGWVAVWTVGEKGFELLKEFGQGVYHLTWSPGGKHLAVCGVQMPLLVMDAATRTAVYTLGRNTDVFTVSQWSPDGQTIAAGGAEQAALWTLPATATGPLEMPTRALAGRCVSLAWSPDGKQLATTSGATVVQLWDAASGKPGAKLAENAIKLAWHVKRGELLALDSYRFARWKIDGAKGERLADVAAAAAGASLWTLNRPIVTGLGTAKLALWDATTAKRLASLESPGASVGAVVWSRDGKTLAGACSDAVIRVWNAAGEVLHTLKGYKGAAYSLSWSPDGKYLAAGGSDTNVYVWDRNGEAVRKFEGHKKLVRLVAWTAGGQTLASASDDQTIAFWGLQSDEPLRKMKLDNPTHAMDFTALGKTMVLACSTSRALSVYNAVNGLLLVSLPQRGGSIATTLAWAPSGGTLLVGRSTEALSLLDLNEKKSIRVYYTAGNVRYGDWTPNGATVVAGNADRTVQFFEAQNAALRGTILDDEDGVTLIGSDGHLRNGADTTPNLVYIAQTLDRQVTLTPAEFAAKFGWRNNPVRVKLTPR